ncbi:SPOR domain-containing protein, partial [Hansschlegelia beijingensis]
YYRVRVGPFGSSTDASTVCNNLRAAGGDCVVARN